MPPVPLFAAEEMGPFLKLVDAVWLNPQWLADRASVWVVPLWEAALAMTVLFVFCKVLAWVQPKTYAVAITTAKEGVYQPLFYLILLGGSFMLGISVFISYYTFGEDVKMVKDAGLTLIMILSIILALWTASTSIADEIEGRTALTLLSKPISRRQFIVGKFVGITLPVAITFVVLGTLFLYAIAYKVGYDAKESGTPEFQEADRMKETVQVMPGLVLAFFEAVVITAISVAISTRLPMLPNLLICASVYVLGHLAPMLVEEGLGGKNELVGFIAQLLATILPNLDTFNIYAAVSTGATVPLLYLAGAFLYCLLYSTMVLFVALIMFEDRDLA